MVGFSVGQKGKLAHNLPTFVVAISGAGNLSRSTNCDFKIQCRTLNIVWDRYAGRCREKSPRENIQPRNRALLAGAPEGKKIKQAYLVIISTCIYSLKLLRDATLIQERHHNGQCGES